MLHTIVAAVMAFSLWLSLQGIVSGTYVIITLLGLNIFFVALYAAIVLGAQVSRVDIQINQTELLNQKNTNLPVMFLVRLMFLIGVWHVFNLGYVFLAGAALVTVTINTLSIIVMAINDLVEKR